MMPDSQIPRVRHVALVFDCSERDQRQQPTKDAVFCYHVIENIQTFNVSYRKVDN